MKRAISILAMVFLPAVANAGFSSCDEAYSYASQLRDPYATYLISHQAGNWQELQALRFEAREFLNTHGSCLAHRKALNSRKTVSVADRERESRRLEILRETQRQGSKLGSGRYWECYKPDNYVRCGVGNAP
jgi:hypothetical protein